MIGYEGANRFRIWNPSRNAIIVTRDVTFDENTKYGLNVSIQDPLLIREYDILELIDEYSMNNSIRQPYQLTDATENAANWGNSFDSSSIYSSSNHDNEFEKAENIILTNKPTLLNIDSNSPIRAETYLTSKSFPEIPDFNHTVTSDNTIETQIPPQSDSGQLSLSSSTSTISEPGNLEDGNRANQSLETRVNKFSADLDQSNILSDDEKRPRKAPRRDVYALVSNYETFFTAMSATVNNPEIIGRKLSFVSTLKAPPQT